MKNWINSIPILISVIFTLFILFFGRFLPAKLPLFYSLPWGDKQLVSHQQFLIIPGLIIFITLINVGISWQLHSSQIFFKKLLTFSSWLVAIILIITFLKIIFIFV
ncbi:hypothetical protein A3J13_02095 [Candidatus Daviesbacteria bacterium RIFCSPLOWO2_02_FULL_36_8]|uniref:DUF1648 domain-containing protein n=1 Tax=Candidatus Daviesbacteria bacterium RIFCSPLOWO2_02_FULL_36_8 TaxID=1797793 RepID=A0A1F5MFC1_9BACT|nr:MAG: hypothetical protein A3J13_02095 [Candidatus Daviesbacteria bacterium RIFCSPLOWO2_02_FULL_36_8]